VLCAGCGEPLPAGAKFCIQCGTPTQASCPSCGASVVPGARFCMECGSSLVDTPTAPRHQAPISAPAPTAERRVTSVLFGDLVGFTPLSESRDPEEVREILSRYFAEARKVVERYGGTVEKFIGDAVMAVWGVPVAHEDDAQRAVRAGLDLVAAVEALGEDVGVPDMAARVGIVTGEVAATIGAVGEGMVAGDAVNTAARVQAVAAPGQVWVDEPTRSLTSAAMAYADVGAHALKGKAEPIRLYHARGVTAASGGSQRVDGLEAPFTGRDRELRLVKELLHAVIEDGRSRLVSVWGTAGVGKSRLDWEFEKYVDGIDARIRWHRGRALSYGDGVAFWSLAEMVRARLGIADGDPVAVQQQRLNAALAEFVPAPGERDRLTPRLSVLLGLEPGHGAAFSREDLFAAWTTFFERVATDWDGVVLVFEDLQHADSSLLDFIDHLMESAQFPLFVLTFSRPELAEARPSFGIGRRATPIHLEPLPDAAMDRLVDGLVDGLPVEARQALTARAEGIPLYAVETVRALIDRDAVVPRDGRYVLAPDAADKVDFAELVAPTSLQALIAARLDALSPDERRFVGDASVHGMTFSLDALRATSPVANFDAVLAALVRKEIVELYTDQWSPERGQYRFVQALVRTVAYDTLSRRDRKARHLAVAAHIAAENEGEELAGVLARHYLDALDAAPGDPDADQLRLTAVALLEKAAARARAVGSIEEALRHYLTALDRDPDLETEARLHEGAANAAGSLSRLDEGLAHAARARELFDGLGRLGDSVRALAVYGGLLIDNDQLEQAAETMAPVYASVKDDSAIEDASALLAGELARTYSYQGRWSESERYAKHALQSAEARADWPQVVGLLTRYATLWMCQGVPTGGLAMLSSAIDLARRHHLPQQLLTALANKVAFNNCRDLAAAEAAGREALDIAAHLGSVGRQGALLVNVALCHWFRGGWDEIAILRTRHDVHHLHSEVVIRLLGGLVARERGRLSEADLATPEGVEHSVDLNLRAHVAQLRALQFASQGRHHEATGEAAAAVEDALEAAAFDDDFIVHWPLAVEYALAADDVARAQSLVAIVADAPPGLVPPLVSAQLPRLRGLTLVAAGEPDRADADLARAVEELRAFGARFALAQALVSLAELRIDTGGLVTSLLDEARAIFTDLEAKPWLESVDRLAAAVPV
jgi:class 3 adenylate cyclase/tetratricopeptide (TPR) repeat protein